MKRNKNRSRIAIAVATAIFASAAGSAWAQSNIEGYAYGTGKAGTEVTIVNPATGFTRSVTIPSGGSFRTPNVPPGSYEVTFTDSSGAVVKRSVGISIGGGSPVNFEELDEVVVTSNGYRPQVDMTSTESVTSLSAEQLQAMPVARDVQQVALLAPGVIQGDGGFESQSGVPLVSFGGASSGENSYYINGFNVSDFRNFLGGATIPFEFYDQFELRTGGYSAEFGRALGGVVNAVSKRGTNKFEFGASVYWQPDSLTQRSPDSLFYDPDAGAFTVYKDNSKDFNTERQFNLHASGAIIQDKLFFYALGVIRKIRDDDAVGTTSFAKTNDNSPFFGGKLDWQIADAHSLEFTYLRDKKSVDTEGYGYDATTKVIGDIKSRGTQKDGGDSYIARYSGQLMDNLTLTALAGRGKRTEEQNNFDAASGAPCTYVYDARNGINPLSCWDTSGTGQISSNKDKRDAYRIDLNYLWNRHSLKLGYDYEENTSNTLVNYEGGTYWRYVGSTPGTTLNGGTVPAGVTQVARERFYDVNGSFKEKLSALYVEDNWQVTDRLLLSLGLRNETLENLNKDGVEFLDFGSQLTPRLGFTFDMLGDGRTKIFGNAGRYTMPIATNTNIRFAGGEFFTEQYYQLNSVQANGLPVVGPKIGSLRTLSDGAVPVPEQSVDKNIKPMYQDEFILGIQSQIMPSTVAGLKVTYRNLVRAVEDSSFVDEDNNFFYFLFNPGHDVTLQDADGVYHTITAADLGYPKAKRRYWAGELSFEHTSGNQLRMGGSYTLSHSYGNFEGVFQSDVQQDDAGITIDFDTPGLALFTNGSLPNDRRHIFKLYGTYAPVPSLTLSLSGSASSGRPQNARGNCPPEVDPDAYEEYCFYAFGEPSPRGAAGRLPWLVNLDLGVRYTPELYDSLTFGLDVFNLFDFSKPTRVYEIAESAGGEPYAQYGSATYRQQPRYVRFSAVWNFK